MPLYKTLLRTLIMRIAQRLSLIRNETFHYKNKMKAMNDYDLNSFVQKLIRFTCDELNSKTRKETMYSNILEGR